MQRNSIPTPQNATDFTNSTNNFKIVSNLLRFSGLYCIIKKTNLIIFQSSCIHFKSFSILHPLTKTSFHMSCDFFCYFNSKWKKNIYLDPLIYSICVYCSLYQRKRPDVLSINQKINIYIFRNENWMSSIYEPSANKMIEKS